MNAKRSGLVIAVAVVLLFSMAGMASATSQMWNWTDYATGLPTNADYQMHKTSGVGSAVIDTPVNTEYIWVADEAVTSGPLDMHGTWPGIIEYYIKDGGDNRAIKFKVQIGILSGGTFTSKDEETLDTTQTGKVVYDWDISLTPDPFSISNGQYLAMKFTNQGDSSPVNLLTYYTWKPGNPTYINSPPTDPGYPVPELPTLLLTSVGVLMLGGFVVYSRRRKNN